MRILLIPAALLLAACTTVQTGGSDDQVRFVVAPASVAAGDSVVLTLENRSGGQVGYNLCASSIERQTASGWEVVPSDIVCTMELRILETGQEAMYRTAVPSGLSSGLHRYVTNIQVMAANEGRRITTGEFRVTS